MKQLPNIFTLLNLFFGCIAIVFILQNGMLSITSENGDILLMLPEKIYWASVFIAVAAVIDFLDGFVARLLRASSELGKQLDSLADVVSFGVAPGLIVYQFLRLAYAQQPNGLDVSFGWLLPAFIIPCAGAYRLGRFNVDKTPSVGFRGVPIPSVGLLIASFPLIYWYSNKPQVIKFLLNPWFWYGVIIVTSYLMISTLPMLSLKFTNRGLKDNLPKIVLVVLAILLATIFKWISVPLIFVMYVILSLAFNKKSSNNSAIQ